MKPHLPSSVRHEFPMKTAALPAVIAWSIACSPGAAGDIVYPHAAVACDHPAASEAGLAMLRQGGNAVDAAVAASFTLSVVRPYSCGIGGGGFMLIFIPSDDTGRGPRTVALNYRETAPAAVGSDYYENIEAPAASRDGPHAVGVPGTVAGLLHALDTFGSLSHRAVLAPAIAAAENGFPADRHYVRIVGETARRLAANPPLRQTSFYLWLQLCHSGKVSVGERISNPRQAEALRLIAAEGADAFYRGEIAHAIVDAVQAHGGRLTFEDLAGYRPAVVEPLRGRFRGYEVLAMPPPSSGGIALLQILGIVERLEINADGTPHNSASYVHLVVEAFKHAFADRARHLADPAFVDVPVARLLDDAYLDRLAASIRPDRTLDPAACGYGVQLPPDGGTSHLSVIDAAGMAVACTETINLSFGSLVEVPGFGFALNNEMDDFTTRPGEANAFGLQQSDRNLPQPGKRPLSSMSPTIILRDGRVHLVVGASGGPRIITGVTQCILNCVMFDMSPEDALAAPRFHHQWIPDMLLVEDAWSGDHALAVLRELGHEIGRRPDVGVVQVIGVLDDGLHPACDPRKGGRPAGY